jgi:ABC-type amino acid transport system permease subunit
MLGVGIVLSYVQPRRGTAALAQAFALCLFLFLAFNKQAFANYYFLVIAALCAAAAVELGCSAADQSTDKAKAAAAGAAPASLPA